MKQILYSGKDLRLSFLPAHNDEGRFIVTFDIFKVNEEPSPQFSRQGFGENVFCPHGINELHITHADNNWYQSDEMHEIIPIIKNIIKHSEHQTYTYGASMGGFGAINFACDLGASVIAFCPQASLHGFPVTSPWQIVADRIPRFRSNICESRCLNTKGWIFFDALCAVDKVHALFIKRHTSCSIINIPFAGHAIPRVLNKHYGLRKLVLRILRNNLSPRLFKRELMSTISACLYPGLDLKIASKQYTVGLYDKCFATLNRAIQIYPDQYALYAKLGLYKFWRKCYDESEAAFVKGLELLPAHPDMNLYYGMALEKQGKIFQAISHFESLTTNTNDKIKAKLNSLRDLAVLSTTNN